jgi:hypothetical protein
MMPPNPTAFREFFSGLKVNPHNIRGISDMVEFIKKDPREEYSRFGAKRFEEFRDTRVSSTSEEFLAVKSRMKALGQEVVTMLDRNKCDLLIIPPRFDIPLDLGKLPAISVPAGYAPIDTPIIRNKHGHVCDGPNFP